MTLLAFVVFLSLQDTEAEIRRSEALLRSKKAVRSDGILDPNAIQADPAILPMYFKLGEAYLELAGGARREQRLDDAMTVFSNVLRVAEPNSEPWWQAKLRVLECSIELATPENCRIACDHILRERLSRDFDGGRFGMKARFAALLERMRRKAGR